MLPFSFDYFPCSYISRDQVAGFLNELNRSSINLHSFVLQSHGVTVAEAYRSQYSSAGLQRCYSIAKTYTAIAIGLLADQQRIGLDDAVYTYFPEYIPENPHPWITSMTIRDMLMMRTCFAKSTHNKADTDSDFCQAFFTACPDHKPGTIFSYDSTAAYVLGVLVERITKLTLLDFLRQELPQLEISAAAYMLRDSQGRSICDSGLMCTTPDLLHLGQFLLDCASGQVSGISPSFLEFMQDACASLTPTLPRSSSRFEGYGYGYFTWSADFGCFLCYGIGGQFILVSPSQQLVLVTTANTFLHLEANQLIINSFYTNILQANYAESRYYSLASVPPLLISGEYKYAIDPNESGFTRLTLSLKEDGDCMLILDTSDDHCLIPFNLKDNKNQPAAARGIWLDSSTLFISVEAADIDIKYTNYTLFFGQDDLVLSVRESGEGQTSSTFTTYYCSVLE